MGDTLERRGAYTSERVNELVEKLADANESCGEDACVYITGSFARGEASKYSDLDLFILLRPPDDDAGGERPLSRLDEICLKASLIDAIRSVGIPDFSGDGEYLVGYTGRKLKDNLGSDVDDSENTFTARLLLLLESKPLVGDEQLYRTSITEIYCLPEI